MGQLFQNFTNITLPGVIMWCIGGLLIYLAIAKKMEPALLLPMGFGAILMNLPIAEEGTGVQAVIDFSVLNRNRLSRIVSPAVVYRNRRNDRF